MWVWPNSYMISNLLTKIFGSRNDRLLKQYREIVAKINAFESSIVGLSDQELAEKTQVFRQRYASGETLDQILPEAFAVVREAGRRVHGMRHFDVQLIGGIALHQGKIAEMRTGEGKTLMATLPAYLNAISGKGVHIVTVNDYLAQRDAAWMGRIYAFLGLTVGINLSRMSHQEKQSAYAADITYGTNNEFGFDYLRDNMVHLVGDRVQRGLNFAVVDEVDSILIDEARTPLIISGPADDHTDLYRKINVVPSYLQRMLQEPKSNEPEPEGDFYVDEKSHQIHLSEVGHEKAEQVLVDLGILPEGASLYEAANITLLHHLLAALRAHFLYHKDQQYVVQNGEVIIVDEFTGRLMPGRRWSDGLHQAVEAKEGVAVQLENQTLASITFQNYFRMYSKLSGMTGTADTEAYEFQEIYGLETVIIPTNKPAIRQDAQDKIYKSAKEKFNAIIDDIKDCYQRGQPVLVGTTSIEASELLSSLLQKEGLPHEVLNAKQHAREADIVAQAGRSGAITIATNMAGRGTDIVLGGNIEKMVLAIEQDQSLALADKPAKIEALRTQWVQWNRQVIESGGLHIIGSERHESRRIDNQLRGRAGRQGDPGSSRFYLSMEDSLLRIFAGDRVRAIMERLKLPEGEAIEAGMVTRSIESAQRKVEGRNFDMRKQLLEYDDVANEQRRIIYQQRNEVLEAEDLTGLVSSLRQGVFNDLLRDCIPRASVEEQWNVERLQQELKIQWLLDFPVQAILAAEPQLNDEQLLERLQTLAQQVYQQKRDLVGADAFMAFERSALLQSIDTHWREHLASLDYLRQGIHLRGYAQKNPKQEYKREAFELFNHLLLAVRNDSLRLVMTVQIATSEQGSAAKQVFDQSALLDEQPKTYQYPDVDVGSVGQKVPSVTVFKAHKHIQAVESGTDWPKVGRNDLCPCGSGKKYKHCHGSLA